MSINTKINIDDLIKMDTMTMAGSESFLNKLKELGEANFTAKDLDRISKEKYNLNLRGSKANKFKELVEFEECRLYYLEFRENF